MVLDYKTKQALVHIVVNDQQSLVFLYHSYRILID